MSLCFTLVNIRMAPKTNVSSCEGDGKDNEKRDDKKTEIFLKVCTKEILARNRPSLHFSKEGWKNVQQKFHERTNHAYDCKQLKNRWDALKREFSSFMKLVEKQTGLGWDHEKKAIQAPNERWTDKSKVCFCCSLRYMFFSLLLFVYTDFSIIYLFYWIVGRT